jgi:hypothetical protein
MIQPPYPKNIPLLKGALVTIDDTTKKRSTVAFQYNPETLNRSLKPSTVGAGDGERSMSVRFTGAPVETISLEVQIDAMEGLNAGDPVAVQQGIHPQLAALELLIYPASTVVEKHQKQLASGVIEVVPMAAPRTVFVWGARRVVPVRVMSLTVTEQLFDAALNPIRASIQLELRVLSYSDVFSPNPDYGLFLTHQKSLEATASSVRVGNAADSIGVDVNKL